MQTNFKIHGEERRKLKKELNLLKSSVRNFWHYQDLNEVCGGIVLSNATANTYLNEQKAKIAEIENDLLEKNDREDKLKRILNGEE